MLTRWSDCNAFKKKWGDQAAGEEARKGGGWRDGNSDDADGDSAVQNVSMAEPTGFPDGIYL